MIETIKSIEIKPMEQLKKVKFFVEANSFEQQQLWYDYYFKDGVEKKINSWKQESSGFSLTLDNIKIKRKSWPIVVSFNFATINDIYICFYYATSVVVHHGIIEKILHTNYPIKYDKGTRLAYTDASNFHNVYHYCIKERNKRYKLIKI